MKPLLLLVCFCFFSVFFFVRPVVKDHIQKAHWSFSCPTVSYKPRFLIKQHCKCCTSFVFCTARLARFLSVLTAGTKTSRAPLERSPANPWQKAFCVINVVQTTRKNSLWYELPLQRLSSFNWYPAILFCWFLFCFVLLGFFFSSYAHITHSAKRGPLLLMIIISVLVRVCVCFSFFALSWASSSVQTVMNLTKLYKRIRELWLRCFLPLLFQSGQSQTCPSTARRFFFLTFLKALHVSPLPTTLISFLFSNAFQWFIN